MFHLSCYSNMPGREKNNGETIDAKKQQACTIEEPTRKRQREPTEATHLESRRAQKTRNRKTSNFVIASSMGESKTTLLVNLVFSLLANEW